MDYSSLKSTVFQGIGRTTFQDENGADITSQTLCNAINIAQKRLARRKAFGRLYKQENLFLAQGNNSVTFLTNIRELMRVDLFGVSSVTYTGQTTDLPNGLYVDGSNNVYQLNTADRKQLFGKDFDEFERLYAKFYYESGEPGYFATFDPDVLRVDYAADTNYFIQIACKAWPTEFTTSSTSVSSDIKNADDLIILLAQAWIYTSILKEPEKANQLYSVFRNELVDTAGSEDAVQDVEIYVKSLRDADDDGFPMRPMTELSETDLGI